jgi:hypothetical protein
MFNPPLAWIFRPLCEVQHKLSARSGKEFFMNSDHTKIEVGKYLVSPLAKPQGTGQFAASVSIRSGRGSGTHDRVMRFNALFDTAAAALHYATEHAMCWIRERQAPACV